MLYKKNICFLLFTLCVFFVQIGSAQEVTVINQKGTKIKVVNNRVTTSATAPTAPFENDVWFDSSTTPSTIKIYDGTVWLIMEHQGTQGSVFFAAANGLPTEDNSQLFWDSANNRFGVGTNSPTNKLEVSGAIGAQGILNSDGTENEPSFRFKDDTNTGMYSPAADEIGFTVGGVEAMKIDEPTTGNTVVVVNQTLELQGKLLDINNSAGTNGQILSSTATGTQWVNAAPAQTTTTITNTVTGHKIANYTNEAATDTPINETVTSLSQNDSSTTGEITFTDEAGGTTGKAQVVSANASNQIKVGTDGGAYLGPTVYTGSFIITAAGNLTISGIPFTPSQITFTAYANVGSFNIDSDNGVANNTPGIENAFGGMHGFANNSTGTTVQNVIYVGGSGTSINDISRFSSNVHCIGLRYSNQNGDSLGKNTAKVASFNSTGFVLNVDSYASNVIVLYTAYK